MQKSPVGRHARVSTSQKQVPVSVQGMAGGGGAGLLSRQTNPGQHSVPPNVQDCEAPEQVAGAVHTPPVQVSAVSQHRVVPPQLCPVVAHVPPPDPQVPLVSPGGMLQDRPAQQSASAVQAPVSPTQRATHPISGSQTPEQHCASVEQAFPVGAQVAQVPVVPPGVDGKHTPEQQVSSGVAGGIVQAASLARQVPGGSMQPSSASHVVPVQQVSAAGSQALPRGRHAPVTAQCRTPVASGTHGAMLQH